MPDPRAVKGVRQVVGDSGTGESFELGCNRFPGTVAPRGFEHLESFRKDLFPVFEYEAGGVRLRKTVAAVAGENTTLVLYEATADLALDGAGGKVYWTGWLIGVLRRADLDGTPRDRDAAARGDRE